MTIATFRSRLFSLICSFVAAAAALGQDSTVELVVDATDAPLQILHARLQIPAQPGKLTLLYPKWIPGEHGPTGPITDLAGLKFNAGGKPIQWKREADNMYAFDLEVPAGASAVEIALDFLFPPSSADFSSCASSTARLVDLNWNQVLLYPKGAKAGQIQYAATLRLPPAWKFPTALPLASQSAGVVEFSPVSLETLVDSPVIAGAPFRTVELTPGAQPPNFLDIVA